MLADISEEKEAPLSPSATLKHIVAVSLEDGSDEEAFAEAILSLKEGCAPLVLEAG